MRHEPVELPTAHCPLPAPMKADLLHDLREAGAAFVAALAAPRPPSALPVAEDWGVTAILAHTTAWHREAVARTLALLDGAPSREYDVEAFNAAALEERRAWTLEDLEREWHEAWSELLAFLDSLPEEAFARGAAAHGWTLATIGHLREHLADLANSSSEPVPTGG